MSGKNVNLLYLIFGVISAKIGATNQKERPYTPPVANSWRRLLGMA